MKKKLLIIGAMLGLVTYLHAQQPLTHTQHGQLRTVTNPAASLMRMGGEVSVIGRRQWVGMDGAPTVFWGSGHRSEEHTSELQSLMRISYAVFCLIKNNIIATHDKSSILQ